MNELSLFSGAGGGLLGSLLLGHRPIGYVEWDDYCQRVIAARIRDGILPDAPIFGDIKTFISDGYAASYTGMVDIITAGFPCQPFSVAGKQKGADDERNMWPFTADVIGIVKPRFLLLENVPGVRTYLPVVVRDLRRLGYEVSRPLILGADDVGAPHRRKRVWIFAHAIERGSQKRRPQNYAEVGRCPGDGETSGHFGTEAEESNRYSSVSVCSRLEGFRGQCESRGSEQAGTLGWQDRNVTDSERERSGAGLREDGQEQDGNQFTDRRRETADARSNSRPSIGNAPGDGRIAESLSWSEKWPEVAARLCRVDDGVAHRVDRLKALGNGQVPLCVATAFRLLQGE